MGYYEFLDEVIEIAKKAGDVIMGAYNQASIGVQEKHDKAPLTEADIAANKMIDKRLIKFNLPIISEEGNKDGHNAKQFWLVDPLDGTKEYIKKNGEFTVNIGLIDNGEPVLGVVYAPAKNLLYFGVKGHSAYKIDEKGKIQRIHAKYSSKIPTVVISRSHQNEKTLNYLRKLGKYKVIAMGSSLKLCLVAEGSASIYPRLGPTSLWDTAAGDAILYAAGGVIKDLGGTKLQYDPNKILNPSFVASGKLTK